MKNLVKIAVQDHEGLSLAYPLTYGDGTLLVCLPSKKGECLCLLFGEKTRSGYQEVNRHGFLNLNSAELRDLGKILIDIAAKHPRNQPVPIKDS